MSKSNNGTFLNDSDLKQISKYAETVKSVVEGLKKRNAELASLGNLLKANTSGTTKFMNDIAKEVGTINSALEKTSQSMVQVETNISSLSANMAKSFDKMAQSAKAALDATRQASRISQGGGSNPPNNPPSGGLGGTWWDKWRKRANTAEDKIFSADVQGGKGMDADFQAMQQMETQWKTIVSVSSQYLNQMAQVAIQQEKLNLATSQQAKDLADIAAKYQQISQLNNATAQNKNFDENTYIQTQQQKGGLAAQQTNAQMSPELVEMQSQLAILREQLTALRQKAKLEDGSYRATRRETLLQREKQRALDREIKAELRLEEIKNRIDKLEAKAVLTAQETAELDELRAERSDMQDSAKSTTGAGASFFNTSGQMIQVIRELPNFAISAQTGLMSLSNNLPTLFEGFRLAASGGKGLSGVLDMLVNKATIMNVGFVAITMILMNLPAILKAINNDFIDMHQVLGDIGEGLKSGNSDLAKQIDAWETMKQTLLEAKYGLADASQAVSDYNEKFATTLGYARDMAEAYEIMEKNSDKFYSSVLNHEIALTIQRAALEQWRKDMEEETADGTNWISTLFGAESNTANIYNRINDITGEVEKWKGGKNIVSSLGMVGQDKLKDFMKESGGEKEITGDNGAKYVVYTGFNKKVNEEIKKKLGADTKIKVEFGRGGDFMGMEGDIAMRLSSGNSMDVSQDERTAVAAAINEAFRPLTDRVFQEAMKKPMEELRQKFALSDIYQRQTLPTSSGKGSGVGNARKASFDVLQFREGYTSDKFYNERRGELEKRNEELERKFSKQYDSGDKDMYQRRLDALKEYIRNKQEIAEIDTQKDIFNANERRQRELKQISEQRKMNKAQLDRQKKDIDEWNEYVGSKAFQIDKNQASLDVKSAETARDNLAESLKAEGLDKDSKEFKSRMMVVEKNVAEAEAKLKTYTDASGATAKAVYAQSKANFEAWNKDAKERELQIEKDFQTDYKNAIIDGTTKIVKAREEGLQKAIEVHKTALKTELDDVTRRYEAELRMIESFYNRLERLREQKGSVGYENGGALALKGMETFSTGFAGYSRDGNISKIMRNRDAKRKNEDTAQAADEAREETLERIGDFEEKVRGYAKDNSLTDKRKEELRTDFKAGLEGSGKYEKEEIDAMMVKWDDAVANIDTEEGQRAFDELRKSATVNFDKTLDKAKETGQELEQELKDQWVSAVEDQAVEAFKNMVALLDAVLAAEIEYQKRAVNEWVENQTKLVEDQYKSQVIDEKEYQAQKKAIEEEERKRNHEIAMKEEKANRVKATSNVLIATAQAITFASIAAFRDGGVAAPALFAAYIALLAANAAAQIAAIHAAPYPEYALGTDYHKGGLAIVGDAGKSELIETKSGKLYKTPDVPTLMDIERGAKVHPDFSVAMRNLNDDRQIVVLSENKKQLTLLRQTNRSLGAIVANTRTQQRNYNRVWN